MRLLIHFLASSALLTLQLGCEPNAVNSMSADAASPVAEHSETVTVEADGSQAASGTNAAPEVTVEVATLEQLRERIKGQAGQFVVVDIWSTSCAPCMREFPHLVALSKKYSDQVACISFNVDYIGLKSKPPESYLPDVEAFLKKQSAELINLVSATADEKVLSEFDAESIPAILLFDRAGSLVNKFTDANSGEDGLTYAGDVIPEIERLLAEASRASQ